MENTKDKFQYYLNIYGHEFAYRSYTAPTEELEEANEECNLYDYLDEEAHEVDCNCGPYISSDFDGDYLTIEDVEGKPIFTIPLGTLGIVEYEEDAFPSCDNDESVAYIIEWSKGCPGSVKVSSDIDLSKLSLEEIQKNITIEYTNINYWNEYKNVVTAKIVTGIRFFGEDCSVQEESSTYGQSVEEYYIKEDDES